MTDSRGTWRSPLALSAVLIVGSVLTVGATPVSGRSPAAGRVVPAAAATAQPEQEAPADQADGGDMALVGADEATSTPDADLGAALAASETGTIRVSVMTTLATSIETDLTAGGVAAQRAAIAASLDELEGALAGTGSTVRFRFTVVPAAVVEVDADGLAALQASDVVAVVHLDEAFAPALDVSTNTIDSDKLNTAGVLGNGYEGSAGTYEVAIIDSGVQRSHPAFGNRVIAGFCYSFEFDCPNGSDSQSGIQAGRNCNYSSDCDHGTNVAGIAAGNANTYTHEGVARGARISSIQVGSNIGGSWRYYFTDLDRALERTILWADSGRRIAAANMSLGGPGYTNASACAADFPITQNLGAQLLARKVAPVAAAGNDGFSNGVTYPSCLPAFYAVSAVDDSDTPAFFSNRDDQTDWWAPGVDIFAPVPTTSGGAANYSGTSMASPHVAGRFALLRECVGNRTPQDVAADLRAAGPRISANGVPRRRINVLGAATRNVRNNDFADAQALPRGANSDTWSFNVCADRERSEPNGGIIANSVWFTYRPNATGTLTLTTNPARNQPTTFDTELWVFRGNNLGSLQLVAYDDDGGAGTNSRVAFSVVEDTTYRIRVDGVNRQNGRFNLSIERTALLRCDGRNATIVGTPANDSIGGTPGNDVIVSLAGSDTVFAVDGNDSVCGGPGNDRLVGGDGSDVLAGEDGNDRLQGSNGSDTMFGGNGTDVCDGGNQTDTAAANCETVINVP